MTPVQFGPASSNQIYKGVLRELTLLREVCALYRHTPPKISRFRRGSLLQITTPDTVPRLRRCLGQTTQASSPCAQNHAKTTKKGGVRPVFRAPSPLPGKGKSGNPAPPLCRAFLPFFSAHPSFAFWGAQTLPARSRHRGLCRHTISTSRTPPSNMGWS